MIDRGREGTPSNREFLFITAAPFVQKERTKPNVCQSDRTIYVFAYCTLDLIFRLLVKLWKFFFVMVFVDGNRSFDESLIVARNLTTVRSFSSSFFFPVSENFIGSRVFAKLMRI